VRGRFIFSYIQNNTAAPAPLPVLGIFGGLNIDYKKNNMSTGREKGEETKGQE
jgi:hypothetical protein